MLSRPQSPSTSGGSAGPRRPSGGYRETAGITTLARSSGRVPEGHPELATAHAHARSPLELRTLTSSLGGPTGGAGGAPSPQPRVQATAPRESAELRAEHPAEADVRARALELVPGSGGAGGRGREPADAGAGRATELQATQRVHGLGGGHRGQAGGGRAGPGRAGPARNDPCADPRRQEPAAGRSGSPCPQRKAKGRASKRRKKNRWDRGGAQGRDRGPGRWPP